MTDNMVPRTKMRDETTVLEDDVFSAVSSAQAPEKFISHVSGRWTTEDGVYVVLGTLSPKTLITEDGLARLLGKGCRESVKRAVERDELPRPVRLMGKNTWTVGAIVQYIEMRLETEARRFAKARA